MKIGFIGAGKVGCSLAKYFVTKGLTVQGFYSRSNLHAQQASQFINGKVFTSLIELIEDCDCIFITVPDSQIAVVWSELSLMPIEDKLIGHCSGLLSSQVFQRNKTVFPRGFSLHPLYAIHDRFACDLSQQNIYFTLEAPDDVLKQLLSFFETVINSIATIQADSKPLYHAACVILSNQVIALAHIGSQLFNQCNLPEAFSQHAWHKLFIDNTQALCRVGAMQALTGPIERGDVATIKQHLAVIPADIKPIYQYLSHVLLNLSQQKHPERDYQRLQLELSF